MGCCLAHFHSSLHTPRQHHAIPGEGPSNAVDQTPTFSPVPDSMGCPPSSHTSQSYVVGVEEMVANLKLQRSFGSSPDGEKNRGGVPNGSFKRFRPSEILVTNSSKGK